MKIRRRITVRAVVIDTDVIENRKLSPAALGIYCVIAAAPAGLDRQALVDRYGGNDGAMDTRLRELAREGLIEGFTR